MTKWRVRFYQVVKTHSLLVCRIKFVSQGYYITFKVAIQVNLHSLDRKEEQELIKAPVLLLSLLCTCSKSCG